MKVILAPNAFKESALATDVVKAMKKGVLSIHPRAKIIELPLADGGDGLLDSLLSIKTGKKIQIEVTHPMGNQGSAEYGILENGTAIIDMALCSGLNLVPTKQRNPLYSTSLGLGETIAHALLENHCKKFIVGIGGSATVDCGAGAASALGFDFLDIDGNPIPKGGGGLNQLHEVKKNPFNDPISKCQFQIMCDVINPLLGPNGSASVFGPQKGANTEMVNLLEKNMSIFSKKINNYFQTNFTEVPGAGAAGGMGYMFKTFLGGELKRGSKIICEMARLKDHSKNADLIITGEGSLDGQSAHGKLPAEIASIGKELNIPVIGISGVLGDGWQDLKKLGMVECYSITGSGISKQESMANPLIYIEKLTLDLIKWFSKKVQA